MCYGGSEKVVAEEEGTGLRWKSPSPGPGPL